MRPSTASEAPDEGLWCSTLYTSPKVISQSGALTGGATGLCDALKKFCEHNRHPLAGGGFVSSCGAVVCAGRSGA